MLLCGATVWHDEKLASTIDGVDQVLPMQEGMSRREGVINRETRKGKSGKKLPRSGLVQLLDSLLFTSIEHAFLGQKCIKG
jgi:hypothetical protein